MHWVRAGLQRLPSWQGTIVRQKEANHQAAKDPKKPLPCVARTIG
ncbi:hypothetical protein CPCC7001_208 [Cyanobium sp. PCC 7001]|nr:hypothetical protein CPCC7001_208 [Cyanobium sp. PCC 7001]